MPTRIINLDELLGEPKRVELAGKTYKLPGDLPVDLYLAIQDAAGRNLGEAELIALLYDRLLELFRFDDPSIESLPLGVRSLVQVIPAIYGEGEQAAEERPTTRKTRGGSGAKAPSRPRTQSRS